MHLTCMGAVARRNMEVPAGFIAGEIATPWTTCTAFLAVVPIVKSYGDSDAVIGARRLSGFTNSMCTSPMARSVNPPSQ